MSHNENHEHALRQASWQRVREDFSRLESKPLVSLVGVVRAGNADTSVFIQELAGRENRVHWQATPIRLVDDQAYEYEPVPASNRLFAFGESETWEAFRVVAMRAGVMAEVVSKNLLPDNIRNCMSDLDRWAWVLFELGWRKLDTIPFRAERWVRIENGGAVQLELARTAGLYRGWYYSEIGDAVSASIDVIDVLRLAPDALGKAGGSKRHPPKHKGRKPDTDPKADRRIAEAWSSASCKTYAELGCKLNISRREVLAAIDRDRKRRKRR